MSFLSVNKCGKEISLHYYTYSFNIIGIQTNIIWMRIRCSSKRSGENSSS